jgi:DNA polymerase-3 subunit gamma/tau
MIGQDFLVQTLKNSIELGRLSHAFILTGTRGVGKTTTARLIARALNCVGEDGKGQGTSEPCGICPQCLAISSDSHVDVVEIDAATHTGVDNIRDLLEGVNYHPIMGRYKIYIVDEVHMLSKSAFNALLKTLEEPPLHVKFIFATTEVRKVPLTILSRCQRFDLRRVRTPELVKHFKSILGGEKVEAEEGALLLIADAAGGSVRDGLSILEQALLNAEGLIKEKDVRHMLGLLDRGQLLDLFQALMSGKVTKALELAHSLCYAGSDPENVLQDLLNLTHHILVLKTSSGAGVSLYGEQAKVLSGELSVPDLVRSWQIILKGLQELKLSTLPLQTMDVILIRLTHVQEIMQKEPLKELTGEKKSDHLGVSNFLEMVRLFESKKDLLIADYFRHNVSVQSFKPGHISLSVLRPGEDNLHSKIAKLLNAYTGESWIIDTVREGSGVSLAAQEEKDVAEKIETIVETNNLQKITELFPGAKITIS